MTIFTANICNDATTRTVSVGGVPTLVTDCSVAENYQGRDRARHTQYVQVSFWRDKGAKMKQYLKKGRSVTLQGRVKGRGYLTQEIVDLIKASEGDSWKKIQIPCQLFMADPQITFNTANPKEGEAEVDGLEEELPFPDAE